MALLPLKGSLKGNTHVHVHGGDFLPRQKASDFVICKFEQTMQTIPLFVKATVYSSTEIMYAVSLHSNSNSPARHFRCSCFCARCITTSQHFIGRSTLEVSANGHDFSSDGCTYEFVSIIVEKVHPLSGPSLGSTSITIWASHVDEFFNANSFHLQVDHPRCMWGGIVSPASIELPGSLRCTSPPARKNGMPKTFHGCIYRSQLTDCPAYLILMFLLTRAHI